MAQALHDPDPLLTADEVAPLLRVHPRTVRRLSLSGQLAHVRVGRLVYYRLSEVDAYLDRAAVPASAR